MNNITTAKRSVLGAMLLSALLWSACQKTPLPPDVTEPTVFSVKSLDSISTLTAGLKEVYLYTDFGRDTNEVLVFSGTFARVGCQPVEVCPGSVRFEFRNVNEGSEVLPGEAFHEGEFEYAAGSGGQVGTIYRTTFTATDTAAFQGYIWHFNLTDTASGNVVVRDFLNLKPVAVELTSLVPKTEVQSALVRRTIDMQNSEAFPSVQIGLVPDSLFVEKVIQAITTGSPVVDYSWSPDTSITAPQYFESKFDDQYAVTVTDVSGFTASARATGTANLNKPFLTPNFVYSVQTIIIGDQFQLGRVAIQWVDQQGVVWRSDQGKQNADAQFIVTSTEPYEQNEKGQNTRKMSVAFRCILYSKGGEIQDFEGTGVIAVAY